MTRDPCVTEWPDYSIALAARQACLNELNRAEEWDRPTEAHRDRLRVAVEAIDDALPPSLKGPKP